MYKDRLYAASFKKVFRIWKYYEVRFLFWLLAFVWMSFNFQTYGPVPLAIAAFYMGVNLGRSDRQGD